MKSLNAKRIAAVAASLLMGLAVAGQGVSFGSIPIVNNQGQPVVQIVVGSGAKPSDGVVAANIAAVIGNLALTSVNVSASVGNTAGVTCVVTTPSCTLTNQQVWLGESGLAVPSGSYSFTALIGSVLNRAVTLNTPADTKSLQTYSSQYAFLESTSLTITPSASGYSAAGFVPTSTSVVSNYNGGGATFSSFTFSSSGNNDNILQITSSNLPGLVNNWGSYGENSELWITGFPVFDQQSSVDNFALLDAGGAYEVWFNKPIENRTSSNSVSINVPIQLLGQNWTILNETSAGSGTTTSSNVLYGGKAVLAQALSQLQTVYVGHNVTNSSIGGFNVELTDLGQPNTTGASPASINVYYNGVLTNTTQVKEFTTTKFNVTGHTLFVRVNQTFAGLYAYQKWAKMQLFSNLFNLTNGQVFNKSRDPGWNVNLLWTNTSSGGGKGDALEGIVIWNATPATLLPGQSFTFIENPQKWSVKFVGDTLGNNYDAVTATSSYASALEYADVAAVSNVAGLTGITNVTEPAEELTVTSSIPNAFSFAGTTSSSVVYDLTPYKLTEDANAVGATGDAASVVFSFTTDNGAGSTQWVSSTNPLAVQVTGFTSSSATSAQTQTLTFTSNSQTLSLTPNLYNVTSIQLTRALPGNVIITAESATPTTLAVLSNTGPAILYSIANRNYYQLSQNTSASGNVLATYNQQNGQPTSTFSLSPLTNAQGPAPDPNSGAGQWFTFKFGEVAVPTNTLAEDQLAFGLVNSTGGTITQPEFYLNYSATGTHNNMTYYPSNTAASGFNVNTGFRTERGSAIAKISPQSVTVNLAKAQDYLAFVVGPSNTSTSVSSTQATYGPYGIGQDTNLANVTIANVSAKCSFTSSSCNVTGLNTLTATPSVTQAVTSAKINTAVTPLAVLDTNANNASTLIVVGSAYVNSVAGEIFADNPTLATSFDQGGASGPNAVIVQAFSGNRILVAGYTANQTVTAGNQFINDLLSAASA